MNNMQMQGCVFFVCFWVYEMVAFVSLSKIAMNISVAVLCKVNLNMSYI